MENYQSNLITFLLIKITLYENFIKQLSLNVTNLNEELEQLKNLDPENQ